MQPKSQHDPVSSIDQKFTKVFFKGLRSKTTKETVYGVLSTFGPVKYLRLPYNHSLKKNLGYGFVIYSENTTGRYLLEEVRTLTVDGKEVLLLAYLTNSRERKAKWIQSNSKSLRTGDLPKDSAGAVRRDFLLETSAVRRETSKHESYSEGAVRDKAGTVRDTQLALFQYRPTSSRYFNVGRNLHSSFDPHNLMFRIENRFRPL